MKTIKRICGAKIAYETIITDFSDNDNKITSSKPLLDEKVLNQFNDALNKRSERGHQAEITYRCNHNIKEHKR